MSVVEIVIGCRNACPVFPGVSYTQHRLLRDPAGQPVETVRAIREDIAEHVRALIGELLGSTMTIQIPTAKGR